MWLLSMISFLLLGGYLLLSAMRFGIPDMVSDTYYQLQGCTGSEVIGDKRKRNYGAVFTGIMILIGGLMMVCLLDSGKGVQCLAFIGCAGLVFVGIAPNYIDRDVYPIHKGGAIVAAVGCVGWCLSVCWWITAIIACIYSMFFKVVRKDKVNDDYSTAHLLTMSHPWYWLEVAGFVDVFLTYWICV